MDKPIRNLIQKATQDARGLLEEEFGRQLTGTFDILDDGTILPEPGAHLLPEQRQVRKKIIAAVEHEQAGGRTAAEARTAYLREAAFTALNRFVALKMLEARGLVQECVSRGEQSSGFKEFGGLAPGLAELPDHGYRLYIESLFDELGTEVRVLFDRRDPASLLWPRQNALEGILDIINREELAGVWGEDETIGWVYQYFNSGEERKKMREESAAPRNSRELAVRNQFFTPRYVVEFLTDNTLGRTWYEMRQGQTRLKEQCRYLVRRPNEVFLKRGDNPPEEGEKESEGLSQEELLNRTQYIPFRAKKDPRDIRVLDPACGSGHFLLYAFDLLLEIYEECWEEQRAVVCGQCSGAGGQGPGGGGQGSGDGGHGGVRMGGVSTDGDTELQGFDCMAKSHGPGGDGLHGIQGVSQGGDVWPDKPGQTGRGFDSVEHRGRPGAELDQGVSQSPVHGVRIPSGSGDADTRGGAPGLSECGHNESHATPGLGSGSHDQRPVLRALEETGYHYKKVSPAPLTGHRPLATGHRRPLILDYPTTEALHAALPGLVLAHNLHGIDIDPRAVQIAALSLWMRAQKAFAAFNIDRKARPAIQKTNIVTAEPMPGEQDLLEQFTATLQPRFLGQLVERVFDRMKLAGEAGSLLRIEEEIREAIAEAKKQREAGPQHQAPLFAQDEAPRQMDLWEVADIPDDTFWEQAEEKIYQALRRFAESAKNGQAFSRRLFAEDAAQGFAFIDLCRKRYDVALMNPPFGDASMPSKPYIEEMFGDTKGDVYKTFVECFQDRLVYSGHLGIISSRTGFFLSQSTDWRQRVVLRLYRPTVLADLGHGVLDAMVETAAYILRSLSRQERKDLVLSLVPELTRVPKDQKGCFSIPKYQKAREGLKRHQAVAELEMLMAGGFLEEVPGGFRQFRPLPARIRSVAVPAPRPFSPMTCLRAVEAEDKEGAMREQVRSPSPDNQVYVVRPDSFADVPNAPFAYWVSDRVRRLFQTLPPFESEGRTAKQGLATADDFRFVRLWWEVPAGAFRKRWFPFAKGGEYSPYYADIHLVVNWEADGRELVAFDRSYIRNPEYYFRPGLTWPLRSQRGFSLRAMPQDCTFAHKGPACIIENDDRSRLAACICIMNSQIFNLLLSLQMAFGSYEVGVTQRTPMLHPDDFTTEKLSRTGRDAWKSKRRLDAASETSHAFGYPGVILQEYSALEDSVLAWNDLAIQEDKRFADIQKSVDELCFHLYGLSQEDVPLPFGTEHEEENEDTLDEDASLNTSEPWQLIASLVSWANGVAQGRFDPRSALDQTLDPEPPDPFSALPACSPGMLMRPDGLPAESGSIVSEEWLRARPDANTLPPNGSVAHPTITDSEYPVRIPWDGILVDDPGFEGGQLHDRDVVLRVREVLEVLWKDRASDIEQEACDILGVPDLRAWFRKSFFPDHIKRYSKSRRKAPIYWQLATPSASYSVWLYYHRFTRDTFYQVLNEYVAPKVRYEERELDNLRQQVGPNPSAGQRKELAAREAFVEELKTFREEVSRVAPLWNPNLNDGVIINFAPLWRLVPQHKPWQKECKACWDKLVKGDYDWAHLAMHLWPERVVPKCAKDRSLAIAHGLEDTFWEEDDKGKWAPKKVSGEAVQDLIAERTSPTVKAALDDLLKAPAPAGTATKRRKKKA